MRILHVSTSLDPVSGGGTAERTYQLCRALTEADIECSAVTLGRPVERSRLDDLGATRVLSLPVLSQRFYVPRGGLRQVYRAVRDADMVHLIGHWTLLNALAYLAATRLRRPYVVCPSGALPLFGRSLPSKRLYNRLVGRRMVRHAHHHVAITEAERRDFESYGVAASLVSVIPNGVRAGEACRGNPGLPLEGRTALTGGAPYILFIGRLNVIKGPDLLLEAFTRARSAVSGRHLVFVGNDEGMRGGLEESARADGLGDVVHFVGPLHGSAKWDAYVSADLLVVPSRREAMSIVALEAGSVGTPVLLTDTCGFDDIEAAGAGRVVPATSQGLEKGLRQLLAAPASLHQMGEAMRRLVADKYTWEHAAERYLTIYREIVDAHQP